MTELLAGLPPLLASHLAISILALAIACAVSLPLAVVLAARPRLAGPVVAAAGVIQTVPGLALLALMVPFLAQLRDWGAGVSPFGFAPALVALALYAILPILRNAVTGLRGVDPATVEAARAMGMSPGQVLRGVQLPLAAPVIAAGIRTATVWTVGAATLATPVGQACLGNYIFAGLQTRNWPMLLVGVAASAALAVALDLLLAWTERALAGRPRNRVLRPIAALAVLVVGVIGVLPRVTAPAAIEVGAAAPVTTAAAARVTRVRIGAKTFTEQYILAEVLRARLAQAGIGADVTSSLGSTVIFDALAHGDIDVYVDYSGTLWTTQLHGAEETPRWAVLAQTEGWLARETGVRSLGSLGFENAYAIAVRRETAAKLHLASLADLAAAAPTLALGTDYEFQSRREWGSVRAAYGIQFGRAATFDPALVYDAVSRGDVDAIAAFSSDGRIAADDLVVLADPAGALPPYDALLLLGARIASDAHVLCALSPLHGAIGVDLMQRANLMVDQDHATPAAAATWLLAQIHAPACAP